MTADDVRAIASLLERYRFFHECLLESVSLSHYGTALDLDLRYIWDDEAEDDATLDPAPRIVVIRLHGMCETNIVTDLPSSVVDEEELANWGLTEVASVRLLHHSDLLAKHHDAGRPLYHLAVDWEGDRRIDSVFTRFELIDPPRESKKRLSGA